MKLYQSLTSEIRSDLFQNLIKLLDFKVLVFLFVGHLAELFFFVLLLFLVDVPVFADVWTLCVFNLFVSLLYFLCCSLISSLCFRFCEIFG